MAQSYVALFYYLQKRQFRVQADPTYMTYKTSAWPSRFMAFSAIETRTNFSTQSLSTNDPVISVDRLHANLREPDMKVFAFIYVPVTLLSIICYKSVVNLVLVICYFLSLDVWLS